MKRWWSPLPILLTLAVPAEGRDRVAHVAAVSHSEVRSWDDQVERLVRAGQLAPLQVREDTQIAGRRHERFAQLHRGVAVYGGELVRQSDDAGTLTVFGTLLEGIDVAVTPALSTRQVESALARRGGRPFGSRGGPELVILPLEDGTCRLTYRTRAFFERDWAVRQVFVDAQTGETVLEFDDLHTQVAATGTGVLGDRKKLSVSPASGSYVTDDKLRPPMLRTYDFRFDVNRLVAFLNSEGTEGLVAEDLARDEDNSWTDGAVVDAHVYAGWSYDYYYKRHGRRGLDNANIPIHSITHALKRETWNQYTTSTVNSFFTNAIYFGDGIMYYGDGLPSGIRYAQKTHNYYAGALDIVAHELSHGVIDYSSRLTYRNESGALNEAFCDIIGTSVEFAFQPDRADYLVGEDVVTPGGFRSMQNPNSYGYPDHVSQLYTGTSDNGGVHYNSSIVNHAFYLAIEGGRHRMGGTVQGVGGNNREQIEKVFYRAFTSFLVPSSNFLSARNATLQAARELFGAGSPAEAAVDQAWRAVGVS